MKLIVIPTCIGIFLCVFYVGMTIDYFTYVMDLLTDFKPCIGIGEYCSYYTETEHCRVGSDYVMCDIIGDGIGYD